MLTKSKKKFWMPSIAPLYKAGAGGGGYTGPTVNAVGSSSPNTSVVTITTTVANCLIFACGFANAGTLTDVSAVTGNTLGAFTRRLSFFDYGLGGLGWVYWKLRPTAGTEVITATYNGTTSARGWGAFAAVGANTSSPFSVPFASLALDNGIGSGGSSTHLIVPSSNQLLYNFCRANSDPETPHGAPWTTVYTDQFYALGETQQLSAAGTVTLTEPASGTNGFMLDAITG